MERKRIVEIRRPSGAAVMRPDITEALARAFFSDWAEHGYDRISLERVAGRAKVGKAALYRRWKSRDQMAADLVASIGMEMTGTPDTGSLEGDVRALLRELLLVLRHPLARRLLPDILARKDQHPALRSMVARLGAERRERVRTFVGRAVARGELTSDCDPEIVADLMAGPLYWRAVATTTPPDRGYVERLAEVILAGLRRR